MPERGGGGKTFKLPKVPMVPQKQRLGSMQTLLAARSAPPDIRQRVPEVLYTASGYWSLGRARGPTGATRLCSINVAC